MIATNAKAYISSSLRDGDDDGDGDDGNVDVEVDEDIRCLYSIHYFSSQYPTATLAVLLPDNWSEKNLKHLLIAVRSDAV